MFLRHFYYQKQPPPPPPHYSLHLVVTNRNGERGKSNSQGKTGTGNLKSGSNPENWKIGFSEISAVALSFPNFPCVKSSSL